MIRLKIIDNTNNTNIDNTTNYDDSINQYYSSDVA